MILIHNLIQSITKCKTSCVLYIHSVLILDKTEIAMMQNKSQNSHSRLRKMVRVYPVIAVSYLEVIYFARAKKIPLLQNWMTYVRQVHSMIQRRILNVLLLKLLRFREPLVIFIRVRELLVRLQ